MKFLCIAREEEQKLNRLSKAEWQALRQQTLDYVETLRKQGRLIVTHALQSATTASIVRIRDGNLSVTDGPFAETKEQIGGFFSSRREVCRKRLAWRLNGPRPPSAASRCVR